MLDTPRVPTSYRGVSGALRGGDTVRVLGPADLAAATRLAALDPVANVFVLSRLRCVGLGTVPGWRTRMTCHRCRCTNTT